MKDIAQKGFSLIEIIIVITIISFFSGLSIAGYHQFNELRKLDAERNKLLETLDLALKRTFAAEKKCVGQGKDTNVWYKVTWTTSFPYSYSLIPVGTTGCNIAEFTHTLPSSMIIENDVGVNQIFFYNQIESPFIIMSGCVENTIEWSLWIRDLKTGRRKYITVSCRGSLSKGSTGQMEF